jgi:hypothetical protein
MRLVLEIRVIIYGKDGGFFHSTDKQHYYQNSTDLPKEAAGLHIMTLIP